MAKHAAGMRDAHEYLGSFARQQAIPVVIVNAVGENDGFICSGGSAAWRHDGSRIGQLSGEPGLLVVDV